MFGWKFSNGQGPGRTVVLLAGSGNSAHVFDEFAPKLARRWHVYGITRRGYGASSRPASRYGDQRLADDVVQVLDSLGIAGPVLVGHSMAGGKLTTIGHQHSSRLSGLVYLDALGDPRDWPASDPEYMALFRKLPPSSGTPVAPESEEERKSFSGSRATQLRTRKFVVPESELCNVFETNPDGTKGEFIQPLGEGENLFSNALPQDRRFALVLHHVCIRITGGIENWERHRASIDEATHPIAMESAYGDFLRILYTDERVRLGHYVEHMWMSPFVAETMAQRVPNFPPEGAA